MCLSVPASTPGPGCHGASDLPPKHRRRDPGRGVESEAAACDGSPLSEGTPESPSLPKAGNGCPQILGGAEMKKNVLFTRCTESHVHSGTRHMSTVTQCPTYIRKVSALAYLRPRQQRRLDGQRPRPVSGDADDGGLGGLQASSERRGAGSRRARVARAQAREAVESADSDACSMYV